MVQWLRMQALGMEVLGLNSGHDQFRYFYALPPPVTALLEYLNPMILHLLSFCFITCSCKSVAVLTTKRHSYDDQPMYTRIFKLFLYSVTL